MRTFSHDGSLWMTTRLDKYNVSGYMVTVVLYSNSCSVEWLADILVPSLYDVLEVAQKPFHKCIIPRLQPLRT